MLVTGAKRIRSLRDLGAEFLSRASDDRHASVCLGVERLSGFCGDETQRITRLDLTRGLDKLGREGVTIRSREYDELVGPRPQAFRTIPRPRVLLHRHVEIRATESEGADRAAARMFTATNPGTCFRVDVQRPVGEPEQCVGLGDLERWRQHTVVERERDFDQSCGAGGRLRVPDLRLHRTERAPRVAVLLRWPEDRREPARLSGITGLRRRAVRLDQLDRCRAIVGFLVRTAKCLGLTFGPRRVDTGTLSVRRRTESTNDRVDLVTITLCVFEAA